MTRRPRSRHAGLILPMAEGRRNLGKVSNKRRSWGELLVLLSSPTVTRETLARFLKMPKEDQDRLKNVNGYWIGAECADGRRHKSAIFERGSITFDIDNAPPELVALLELGLTGISHYEFAVHSTRKHTEDKPRLRIVFPLKQPIPIEQYAAAARILASKLDPTMEAVDDVSFRPAQMMFYPSHSRDSEFVFIHNPGVLLDAGAMLAAWGDWQDYTKLPFAETQGQKRPGQQKMEDPTEKAGLVGAFCRAYSIEDAITEFLPDIYTPGDSHSEKPRYTYTAGSTSNGAIVEDGGLFLTSFHGTDPVADRSCNSFDLVRIHLFGDLDPDTVTDDTPPGKLPSFRKMMDLASHDDAVLAEYNPHLEDLFDDEDVAVPEPAPAPANGHVNGHHDFLTEDPEIAFMLGLGPAIRLDTIGKKKKLSPLEIMNRKHAIVRMGGKTLALSFHDDGKVDFGTLHDLNIYYANQPMPKAPSGTESLSAWWNKQTGRRTYSEGVTFAPGKTVSKKTYNLWTGFAVAPDPAASCRLFLDHVLNVVCSGDQDQYRYVIGWLAHMIQRPQNKPGVALVLRGLKGAGKDTVGEYVGGLFPRHYVSINRMEQLTGKFNAHQASALLAHVEEGFWAGDKAAASALQSVITSSTSLIEPKGVDPFMVDSFLRVFISSNEKWVVPATADERRYAVFNVSDSHLQDIPYFKALRREMNGGGLGALLHHLLTFDLTDFDVRKVPQTAGLAEQKAEGLKGAKRFWYEILEGGDLADDGEDVDETATWAAGSIRVGVNNLYEMYKDWMKEHRGFGHGPTESKVEFGRELMRLCPVKGKGQRGKRFDVTVVHKFPDLITCRKTFDECMKSNFEWESMEDEEDDLIG